MEADRSSCYASIRYVLAPKELIMTYRLRSVSSTVAMGCLLIAVVACSDDSSSPAAQAGTGGTAAAGAAGGGTGGAAVGGSGNGGAGTAGSKGGAAGSKGGEAGTAGGGLAGSGTGGTIVDASTDVTQEASPDGAAGSPTDGQVAEAETGAPVTACSDISATDCFANKDCPADQRCQNVGTDVFPVACCVVGVRGTGQAGETCASENDCESAVCIAGSGPYLCSKDCQSTADCPAEMHDCIPIAFSGSPDNWCFPN